MPKSYAERQASKVERFVASLTVNSEIFGLLGTGYPGSFYKIYVRQAKDARQWWRFEVQAGPVVIDPIKHQARMPVAGRATAVWAPFLALADFTHDPSKTSMAKLFARAAELRRGVGA